MDHGGQSALFDAFAFLAVCLVASAAVLSYSSSAFVLQDAATRGDALAYAEDLRAALMRTTLHEVWYLNRTGAVVHLGDSMTIERFLLDETVLVAAGLPASNFAAANTEIREVANALVRPPYTVGIEAGPEADHALVWIGEGSGPPADRFTASWTYEAPGHGPVRISVHVWFA